MVKKKKKANTYTELKSKIRKRFKFYKLFGALMIILNLVIFLTWLFVPSPKQVKLQSQYNELETNYTDLIESQDKFLEDLDDLKSFDDSIYRVIFEADREVQYEEWEEQRVKTIEELQEEANNKKNEIESKILFQSESFEEIMELAQNKEEMLACIPAIMPIHSKDLTRITSGYGYRVHPITKVVQFHSGMDFVAPIKSDVYATGDGVVVDAKWYNGYGKYIRIDHGYGYETIYGHLSGFDVKKGDVVKRGTVIGKLGNTGMSVGPHLHYEILKDGVKVNPINYYYKDLTPEDYTKLVEMSTEPTLPLD